ncbi:MAG TPA: tetratricopeptide repeat protein [Candidatus Baltobacteraceae bacterium]|nr:tetratricopeptide repeat protein [Candidatus Baltobacteraceae bacterium]
MKRILLPAFFVAAAFCLSIAATPGTAGAAKPAPSPSASASAAPLPTATPEPPNIAIPRLEQKLKDNPNDTQAMTELAGQFLAINHPEAAVPLTQRLLQLGTKTAQVYYLDGQAQSMIGNGALAVADLEAASNLEPTNLAVLSNLADLYVKTGRLQDADRVANRAVTFNKDDPKAYQTLAGVLAAEQKWDQSRAQLEKAYSLNPKDVSPLVQEAQTWVAQNTIPNALAVVDRAIAVDPKNVQVLMFRGDLFARQNDTARAAAAYDDAIAASDNDAERASVAVHKASMFAAAHKQAQAQATFDAAIRQYPAISSIHTAYGEYYISQRDQRRAEQEFLAALRGDRNDVTALYDLANLKQAQGRTADAIPYLKQITQVAPSAQTFALLGRAYVSVHDYNHAREACGRSFEITRNPDTLGCVAGSDYSLKNFKEASAIFDVLNRDVRPYMDRNPQLLYMAGSSYAHTNQKPKAVDSYKRLLKLMRPGTKTYKQIQQQIAVLTTKQPAPKKKHS